MKTLAKLKQMTFIPHHECGCCGATVGWRVHGGSPWFDSSCDCGCSPERPDTWENVFRWYNSAFEHESDEAMQAEWARSSTTESSPEAIYAGTVAESGDCLKRHRPDIMTVGEGKAMAFMPEDPMGVWCHIQEVRDLLGMKDTEIRALKQKLMAYGDANARLTKENTDLKLISESRGAEVAQLQCDIADLQDRLRASEKQNEGIINSASQIMILQDKALANKERQG